MLTILFYVAIVYGASFLGFGVILLLSWWNPGGKIVEYEKGGEYAGRGRLQEGSEDLVRKGPEAKVTSKAQEEVVSSFK